MTVETQDVRIQQVAKELNVSWTHLVETLEKGNFGVEKRPTAKISREAYEYLLEVYKQDRKDKQTAERLSRSMRDVATSPTKTDKPTETSSTVGRAGRPGTSVTKTTDTTVEAGKTTKEPAVDLIPKEKPKLAGPKITGKIDIEPREKTTTKSQEKKTSSSTETESRPQETAPAASMPTTTPPATSTPEQPPVEIISRRPDKVKGPTIVTSIELPTEKPIKEIYSEEINKQLEQQKQRKRKRIIPKEQTPRWVSPIKISEEPKPEEPLRKPDRGPAVKKDAPPQPISPKLIDEKYRATLARVSGLHSRPVRSRPRPSQKETSVPAEASEPATTDKKILQVTEFISANEMASLLNVKVTEVIKKCMELGLQVSINQRLDREIIELVAGEFGYQVQFITIESEIDADSGEDTDSPDQLVPRPPIVTIMGHVDHGKTSLLDFIRQSNVVAGEKGGITQHIGAYEVTLDNQKRITFLDTPGHEAFTAMRARGAKLTDIVVIVIAADDSVMPQTKEAISHAQAAGVPIIFAFNKMDKPGVSADRIRQQLAEMNLLVEEWGGPYQSQEISAKTGMGVDLLLEKILLQAELLDLKANSDRKAVGTVIEATLDKGRGFVANLLVQKGTLHVGDIILAGSHYGKIKAMFNERGQRIKQAGPSTPVQVLGLDGAPQAGEKFREYDNEHQAKEIATWRRQILREQGYRTRKHLTLQDIGQRIALGNFKEINIIIKADYDGSVEALADSIMKLSNPEIQINIMHRGVGQITESDVTLASASDAIIIGFQVRPSVQARKLAEKEQIEIRLYSIIYDAIEELKSAMEGMLAPRVEEKIVGSAEVREVFRISKVGNVAGCMVVEGKLFKSNKVRVIRDGIVIYTGEIFSLKRFKEDAREATAGQECGVAIKNFNDLKVGDVIEAFEETSVRRSL